MLEYLSDAWIAAMNEAVAADEALRKATAGLSFVLQQTVTGPPGDRTYHVAFADGTNAVVAGPHQAPDVSFTCDRSTAIKIVSAQESAQTAFMAGRLRIGGDSRALITNGGCLAALAAVSVGVRAMTEVGP